MIPVPSGVRVWLAVGHIDMRRGMNSLALQAQRALGRDPHCGDLYVFRGCRVPQAGPVRPVAEGDCVSAPGRLATHLDPARANRIVVESPAGMPWPASRALKPLHQADCRRLG